MPNWVGSVRIVLCVGLLCLSGCNFVGSNLQSEETLTPAPIPTENVSPTATEAPRPTCERSPKSVLKIQVRALRRNDPAVDDGIETVWAFSAPDTKRALGSFERFAQNIKTNYRPLLNSNRAIYRKVNSSDWKATATVTVISDAQRTTYRWVLVRQIGAEYGGCWMTVSVVEVETDTPTATSIQSHS